MQYGHGAVFHIDHVVPRSKGGPTLLENLALQCPHCSLHKADRIVGVEPGGADPVPLFHPLRQRWGEHFRLLPDGTCEGLTPVGRATAAALKMNDPIPRIARMFQIKLGLIEAST